MKEYPASSVLGAVVLVFALGIVLGYPIVRTASEQEDFRTHIDPRLGISVRLPADWHVQEFSNNLGLVDHTGFIASSVPHRFEYPDLGPGSTTSSWDMTTVPADAAVIEVSEANRFDLICHSNFGGLEISELPLSLSDAQRVRGRYGSPTRNFISVCLESGEHFGIHAWIFPESRRASRELIEEAIASLRPLP